MEKTLIDGIDLDEVVSRLDAFASSKEGRLKISTTGEAEPAQVTKQYHLGRCDVGSPWARGCSFDVLPHPQDEIVMDLEAEQSAGKIE